MLRRRSSQMESYWWNPWALILGGWNTIPCVDVYERLKASTNESRHSREVRVSIQWLQTRGLLLGKHYNVSEGGYDFYISFLKGNWNKVLGFNSFYRCFRVFIA